MKASWRWIIYRDSPRVTHTEDRPSNACKVQEQRFGGYFAVLGKDSARWAR